MPPRKKRSPPVVRRRHPVRITIDPAIRSEGDRLACEMGLPLSRYVELLIREALEREREDARSSG